MTATKRRLGVNSLGKQIVDQATREAARPNTVEAVLGRRTRHILPRDSAGFSEP
jgi:hypothetical protein